MKVEKLLAFSLGRRDEAPNIELAKQISKTMDAEAVTELIQLLKSKNKNISSDAIKVLGETGRLNPTLIKGHIKTFIALLKNKNNRLQWGAMAALDEICSGHPALIYEHLNELAEAADKGSVITKDRFVKTLVKLSLNPKYKSTAMTLLLDQILISPVNQLPMYAQLCSEVISGTEKNKLEKILLSRIAEFNKDSQKKRVAAILKKLAKPCP